MLQKLFLKPVQFNLFASQIVLSILFFLSGCAALIYQIMWERMLFSYFGTDLLSITIIVSVFMLGLGIGALLGGIKADLFPKYLLLLYVIIELSISFFGFLSPYLISFIGNYFFTTNPFLLALFSFLILLLPTLLMGATFPILVKQVNEHKQNVGLSVGFLYTANTLGAAAGAYFAGFILLYNLTLTGSIYFAACLNLAVAFTGVLLLREQHI